jgi:mono/diheme cytochrome c family protein
MLRYKTFFFLNLIFLLTLEFSYAEDNSENISGHSQFIKYCAVCHGNDAKGNGPFAKLLTKQPADLTQISNRNAGKFSEPLIAKKISGESMLGAHGTREMPIWGEVFMEEVVSGPSVGITRGRIMELVIYLRSIQER